MPEVAGTVVLVVLVVTHIAVLGLGYYKGYIQGTKDKEQDGQAAS